MASFLDHFAEGGQDAADPLTFARALVDQGVPIFLAHPVKGRPGEFHYPKDWAKTKPNPRLLEAYEPGMAVCAVTGVVFDVIDCDPRNGGDKAWESFLSEHPSPRVYAEVSSPSGGWHKYVARTRHAKVSRDGIDLQAGDDNGQGRGFVFVPGTVRPSKIDGQERPYTVTEDRLDTFGQDDTSGRAFLTWMLAGAGKVAKTTDGPFGALASGGMAGGLGEPITSNHDSTLAAYTASLVARGVRVEEAWQLVQVRLRDVVGGDPSRPFTRADFDRWWSGAERKYTPSAVAPLGDVEPGENEPGSTWDRIDLTSFLDGTHEPERATLMPRSDGHGLIYPGRVHDLHGESESGKSWVAQAEAARLISAGQPVLYLDFESDPGAVVRRLMLLGAGPAAIGGHLDYRRPEGRAPDRYWSEIVAGVYVLAVVDGVTDALGTYGASIVDNDEVARFMRLVVRPLTRTGAAVVLIDHVAKSSEGRGRFAIGAQAKLSGLDGASYVVEPSTPLAEGLRGVLEIRVAKDRPGAVRSVSGPYRTSDRTQPAARFVLDSREFPARVTYSLEAPDPGDAAGTFRPTALMERVSLYVESNPGGSGRDVRSGVPGKTTTVASALAVLVAEGWIEVAQGRGGANVHTSVRPYRQVTDPRSDKYPGDDGTGEPLGPSEPVLRAIDRFPVLEKGTGEPVDIGHPDRLREPPGTTREPGTTRGPNTAEPDTAGVVAKHCSVCRTELYLPDGRTQCARCAPVTRTTDWSKRDASGAGDAS